MIADTHQRLRKACTEAHTAALARFQGGNMPAAWAPKPFAPISLWTEEAEEIGMRSRVEFAALLPETDQEREMVLNIAAMSNYLRVMA
jgi:hypothetical protein